MKDKDMHKQSNHSYDSTHSKRENQKNLTYLLQICITLLGQQKDRKVVVVLQNTTSLQQMTDANFLVIIQQNIIFK